MTKFSCIISLVAIEIFELSILQNRIVALYSLILFISLLIDRAEIVCFPTSTAAMPMEALKFAFISYLLFSSSSNMHYIPNIWAPILPCPNFWYAL